MKLGRIRKIRETLGKFSGSQWNSVGFCMALSMNSVGIPGGFRGNAGFSGNLGFGVVSGRFGGSKGFCANSQLNLVGHSLVWLPLQSLAVKQNFFLCKFCAVKNFKFVDKCRCNIFKRPERG